MRFPAAALPLLLLATPALADPAVTTAGEACTTEPSPHQVLLRARKAPRGAARVRVIGHGGLCDATWSATTSGRLVELTATGNADAPSVCGTCAITVTVRGLARGRYRIELAGERVAVRVR